MFIVSCTINHPSIDYFSFILTDKQVATKKRTMNRTRFHSDYTYNYLRV